MMNKDIMKETFGVISVITILILLYLLAINWQLGRKYKHGLGNRYICCIYLRLLHITSLIETLAYLFNTYGAATSSTECAIFNYSIIIAGQIQLLWAVLAWEIQVRTMTKALQGPRLSVWSRIFWIELTKFMILLPIFGLVLTLSTWKSYWDPSSEPICWYGINKSRIWVVDTRIALNIIVHGVFFLQFLIQTRQASKMVNDLVADLKHIKSNNSENEVLTRLTSDATGCKEKAKSASRRNFIIGANAALWTVLSYGVIPNIEVFMTAFDVYLDRVAMVIGVLTVNCSFYLIFSEWKQYMCTFYHGYRRPDLGAWSSESLLLAETKSGEHFLKRMGEDQEVEYFASPAVIYKGKGKSREYRRTERCE